MGAEQASEPIDLEVAGPAPVRPARRPWLVVVAALGSLGLLGAAVALASDDDVEVAVDEEDATTTTTEAERRVPDPGSFPRPVALGGPTDGKESVGLPVKAEPSTGLVDGQEVTVTGTGFPPFVSVGVVMCAKEAGRDHGARGVEACNIGHFAQAESDAEGVAVVRFSVRRLLVLDGREVDCASEAERCLLGMGMLSDYDTSGGVLVDFDPTVPLPDPPTVEVEPATGLVDGQAVTVSAAGLVPGSAVGATICGAHGACAGSNSQHAVGADGTASFPVRAWRVFGVPMWEPGTIATNVDCALTPCHLQLWGEAPGGRAIPPVDLTFDDGPVERFAPSVVVPSTGPFRPGDELVLELPDLPDDAGAEPMICSDQGCSGSTTEVEPLEDGGQRIRLLIPWPEQGNTCIDRPCSLVVHLYSPMSDQAPPLLFPDPVPVTVVP